jgi:uncharacterized protein (TIGR02118 family)
MITVTVLYRNTETLKFNMNYYLQTHMPLVSKLVGPALKGVLVQHGISGAAPGSKPEFFVIAQLKFDSVESFQKSFGAHADAILGDIPNFCAESPIVQINDIRLG